ncbi:MAG: serine/threonine-protein kinase [Planctomycetaceae bacterium]
MNRPTAVPDNDDPRPDSPGDATFISDIQAAGTVNQGETQEAPVTPAASPPKGKAVAADRGLRAPSEPVVAGTVISVHPPADSSSLETAQALNEQVHLTPHGPKFPKDAGEKQSSPDRHPDGRKSDPGTEKTFVQSSADNVDDLGATKIGLPDKKDSEDFFETVPEESSGRRGDGIRGYVVGDYQIIGELGRGGMGVVYKARHRKLNRTVALKMILAGKHSGNEALQRFIAEARAVATLQHPGIVQIFDIGEHEGLPYFSLEFVEGKDLQKDLNGLPRDPKRSAEMVEQLCIAMQYAHDHKILHRDLKPANILLDKSGHPKITDFGLAKNVDSEASGATNDGTVMGSPSYMPPEQARGDLSSVSPRSDLYSLGAILYQMLTARPPFVAERALDTVLQVINNDPVPPGKLQPSLPVDIETICMKALQKDPAARYPSCAELAADLRRFINGEPILARPVSRLERGWRWCRRNPKVAIPSTLASLFIVATAIISTWAWSVTSAQAVVIKRESDEKEVQRAIAVEEKDNANRQKILADEAKLLAERNEKIAQEQAMLALKNIQLVVTEVDDRLAKEPAMSEIRIAILEILEKKWDELDVAMTGGLQGQAVPTLMTVRHKIAKAWESLDKLADADEQVVKIYEQGKERLVVKGRLDSPRYNLAVICRDWAPIKHRLLGDPAESDRLLQESLALLREIIKEPQPREDSPAVYEILNALAATLQIVGSTQQQQGKLQLAEETFKEAIDVNGRCLKEIADSVAWYTALPDQRKSLVKNAFEQSEDRAISSLAHVLVRRGRTDEAMPLYEAVIKRRRTSLEQNPKDFSAKIQLTVQLISIGQALILAGRMDSAGTMLTEGRDLAQSLHDLDPKNAGFKNVLGVANYYLGTARDEQEHSEETLAVFERSRILRTEILANSPDTSSKVNLMLAEARMGNVETAQKLVDELGESDKKNADLQLDRARALAQLARQTEGDQQSALRDAALTALERAVTDGYSDPFRVRVEPDLKPLRDTERFKSAIVALESVQAGR